MSAQIVSRNPELDVQRRQGLRRMRTLAVALLVFAAVVYLLTRDQDGFLGFVNAGAEASMVGAIADWFAVTALFKHPLGLPIPHTALIPKRKEMLGRSLEEFVGENFLQETVIRERLDAARLTSRVGAWLGDERNARRICDEVSAVLQLGLSRVRDEDMAAIIEEALLPRLLEEPVSPVAGSLLEEVVRDGAHHGLVDLTLEEAHRWLSENEQTFTEVIAERAPWWAPPALNDRVTRRIHVEVLEWIDDIRRDPFHHARAALDSALAKLAEDLQHDPETQERMERLKSRVLSHPQLLVTATSLWNAFRRALLASLDDPDGPVRNRALARADRLRRPDAARRGSAAPPRRLRLRLHGVHGLALRRRAHLGHHPDREPLGRSRGRPPHRAPRRPRPPVHPHQRHHRRRPRRRRHPRRVPLPVTPRRLILRCAGP